MAYSIMHKCEDNLTQQKWCIYMRESEGIAVAVPVAWWEGQALVLEE